MALTYYGSPYGVVTTGPSLSLPAFGKIWYVDGNLGGDGNDGDRADRPLLTMDAAFDRISSGDTIYFKGNITEQLSTPAGIFAVSIIGVGVPRHADAHTSNNGYFAPTWKYPSSGGTATTPLLIVQQQGWRIENILFDGPASAAAVQIFRDGGSGDDERDGSHVRIVGCSFVAAQNHIEFKGGLSQCVIANNLFFGATGDSIAETVGAGIGTNNYHRILDNAFHNNDSHIDVATNYATIKGNTFGKWTTVAVDLSGGSENVVWGNYIYGDYDNAGAPGTNDEWAGNFNVLTGGVTAADPS